MSLETVNLRIEGMTCANCARTVERKLAATPGVSSAVVDLQSAKAIVDYDPERTSVQQLASAVEKLGYQVPQQ